MSRFLKDQYVTTRKPQMRNLRTKSLRKKANELTNPRHVLALASWCEMGGNIRLLEGSTLPREWLNMRDALIKIWLECDRVYAENEGSYYIKCSAVREIIDEALLQSEADLGSLREIIQERNDAT